MVHVMTERPACMVPEGVSASRTWNPLLISLVTRPRPNSPIMPSLAMTSYKGTHRQATSGTEMPERGQARLWVLIPHRVQSTHSGCHAEVGSLTVDNTWSISETERGEGMCCHVLHSNYTMAGTVVFSLIGNALTQELEVSCLYTHPPTHPPTGMHTHIHTNTYSHRQSARSTGATRESHQVMPCPLPSIVALPPVPLLSPF